MKRNRRAPSGSGSPVLLPSVSLVASPTSVVDPDVVTLVVMLAVLAVPVLPGSPVLVGAVPPPVLTVVEVPPLVAVCVPVSVAPPPPQLASSNSTQPVEVPGRMIIASQSNRAPPR